MKRVIYLLHDEFIMIIISHWLFWFRSHSSLIVSPDHRKWPAVNSCFCIIGHTHHYKNWIANHLELDACVMKSNNSSFLRGERNYFSNSSISGTLTEWNQRITSALVKTWTCDSSLCFLNELSLSGPDITICFVVFLITQGENRLLSYIWLLLSAAVKPWLCVWTAPFLPGKRHQNDVLHVKPPVYCV